MIKQPEPHEILDTSNLAAARVAIRKSLEGVGITIPLRELPAHELIFHRIFIEEAILKWQSELARLDLHSIECQLATEKLQ